MKRTLIRSVLTLLFTGLLAYGPSRASAESYFGVRLEGLYNATTGGPLPLLGAQYGANFDGGLGVRVTANTLILISRFGLDGYARFQTDDLGSGAFVGLGVGLLVLVPLGAPLVAAEIHALAGYEWRIAPGLGLSLELIPGLVFGGGQLFVSAAFSLNFYL